MPATPSMWIMAQASSPPKAPEMAEATFSCESLPWKYEIWGEVELTEEKSNPETELFTLVPVAQEECHGRKLTPLEETK